MHGGGGGGPRYKYFGAPNKFREQSRIRSRTRENAGWKRNELAKEVVGSRGGNGPKGAINLLSMLGLRSHLHRHLHPGTSYIHDFFNDFLYTILYDFYIYDLIFIYTRIYTIVFTQTLWHVTCVYWFSLPEVEKKYTSAETSADTFTSAKVLIDCF